jgi:hypothetical protein
MRSRFRILLSLALAAAACRGSSADPGPFPDAELVSYCTIAATPGLESWIGDVVTVCTTGADDESVTCMASRLDGDTLTPLALPPSLALARAMPASGRRLVLLLADGRLVLTNASGDVERELAAWASDPWISDDGERVAWIGLPDGATEWDFGVPTVVATQLLSESARTVLAEDDLASSPRPVPASSDVLYVSAQSGVTAFWIAGPGRPPEQLSNVGLDDLDEDFAPTAETQIAWGFTGLFFSALGEGTGEGEPDGLVEETEVDEVWRLDLAAGEVHEVGPGAWPRLRDDGTVLALQPAGSDPCSTVYTAGGAP